MIKSVGSSFKEVSLVKSGKWKPKSIFVVADIVDIVTVKGILTEGILGSCSKKLVDLCKDDIAYSINTTHSIKLNNLL